MARAEHRGCASTCTRGGTTSVAKYEVLVGMNWIPPRRRTERRAEPGDVVADKDFAKDVAKQLVERGYLEPEDASG